MDNSSALPHPKSNTNVCANCGLSLHLPVCSLCDAINDKDAAYCKRCGKCLEAVRTLSSYAVPFVEPHHVAFHIIKGAEGFEKRKSGSGSLHPDLQAENPTAREPQDQRTHDPRNIKQPSVNGDTNGERALYESNANANADASRHGMKVSKRRSAAISPRKRGVALLSLLAAGVAASVYFSFTSFDSAVAPRHSFDISENGATVNPHTPAPHWMTSGTSEAMETPPESPDIAPERAVEPTLGESEVLGSSGKPCPASLEALVLCELQARKPK